MDELLRLPTTEQLVRIMLATLIGAAIGFERELRGRAAGLRTMILVCLGSTLTMVVSTELGAAFTDGPRPVDPTRIAAGIVTGVGFLGAGVVVKLGDLVRGVTTAATIWFVAAIGIAIGSGYYALGVSATVIALAVLALLTYPEHLLKSHVYRLVRIEVRSGNAKDVLAVARKLLTEGDTRLMDLQGTIDTGRSMTVLKLYVRTTQEFQAQSVLERFGQLEGVEAATWQSVRS